MLHVLLHAAPLKPAWRFPDRASRPIVSGMTEPQQQWPTHTPEGERIVYVPVSAQSAPKQQPAVRPVFVFLIVFVLALLAISLVTRLSVV